MKIDKFDIILLLAAGVVICSLVALYLALSAL